MAGPPTGDRLPLHRVATVQAFSMDCTGLPARFHPRHRVVVGDKNALVLRRNGQHDCIANTSQIGGAHSVVR